MATGNSGIATRTDANNKKPGSYSSDLKRCVTYSSAINSGFTVSNADRYTGNTNRLVRYSDLSAPQPFRISLTIEISATSILYGNGPITLNTTKQNFVLTKSGSSTNLLNSTYGPATVYDAAVVNGYLKRGKFVTYLLISKNYYASDNGTYTLTSTFMQGLQGNLGNNAGQYPYGIITFNVGNSLWGDSIGITVTGPGTYEVEGKFTR